MRHSDEHAIRETLIGRTVTKVNEETLELDDGTRLTVRPNDGCGGCPSGNYWLNELNDCPVNAIMAVEFIEEGEDDHTSYKVFVLAENQHIKLLEVEGSDGNGFYGTGYWIQVTQPA